MSSHLAALLDDFVGTLQQRLRHRQAERLRGFQIDNEFELRRLLDRDIHRLCALEDFVNEFGRATIELLSICSKRDQTAHLYKCFEGEHCRKPGLYREVGYFLPQIEDQRIVYRVSKAAAPLFVAA